MGACNLSAGEWAAMGESPELAGSNSSQLALHSVKAIVLEQKDGKQMEKDTQYPPGLHVHQHTQEHTHACTHVHTWTCAFLAEEMGGDNWAWGTMWRSSEG